LGTKEAQKTISEEEKASLVKGITQSALKMMERIITTKSAKNRARDWCRPHEQSKTGITRSTILFNTLTKTQKLPARPRDIRINLAEEEKSIGDSELSDILTYVVHQGFLQRKIGNFPYPKGKPVSDIKKSGIADERRGASSYYTSSYITGIIDEILSDPKYRESIDNAILNSERFFRFLKYSFEVHFYQMKESQQAFLNTMSPAIRKYGLGYKRPKELDSSYILVKDLTPDKIERLATGYAIDTKNKYQQDGKNILYTVAALFSIFNVYSSGNLKEK
jgi:hypothetical protein